MGEIENGIKYWDLTTSDNFPVSFGVYIFHVESENGNEAVGRFALIKWIWWIKRGNYR